jgi:hypothetical protein
MADFSPLTSASLKTPKAAAVAGILFSVLLITVFWLFRRSVPADPLTPGAWLYDHRGSVRLALNLIPIAGVAFLWFVGVLRDRLGEREDKFFATVFFGSSILFLALLFLAGAIVGALIVTAEAEAQGLGETALFRFGRAIAYTVVNFYLLKMCAVFMLTTSVIALRTGLASRWLAFVGIALALTLVFFGALVDGSLLLFPIWTLVLNINLLYLQRGSRGTQ